MLLCLALVAGCGATEADPFGGDGTGGAPVGGSGGSQGTGGAAMQAGTGGAMPAACAARNPATPYRFEYIATSGSCQGDSAPQTGLAAYPGVPGAMVMASECTVLEATEVGTCGTRVHAMCRHAPYDHTYDIEVTWSPDGATCAGTMAYVFDRLCSGTFAVTCARQ